MLKRIAPACERSYAFMYVAIASEYFPAAWSAYASLASCSMGLSGGAARDGAELSESAIDSANAAHARSILLGARRWIGVMGGLVRRSSECVGATSAPAGIVSTRSLAIAGAGCSDGVAAGRAGARGRVTFHPTAIASANATAANSGTRQRDRVHAATGAVVRGGIDVGASALVP